MIVGFVFAFTYQCNPQCPMTIKISQEGKDAGLDYSECLCWVNGGTQSLNATGYPINPLNPIPPNDPTYQYQRWLSISTNFNNGLYCYICGSASTSTVYEPCSQYDICTIPGLEGFRVATINSTITCNSNPNYHGTPVFAFQLQAPTISNRSAVNLLIIALSALFLIEALCTLIVAYAYFLFKDKYGSDWGRLTSWERNLGILAKMLPPIARLANIISLCFLIAGMVYFFGDQVCKYDLNDQGAVVVWPNLYNYLVAMIVVWIFFCFLGSCFHSIQVRDTSFHTPSFPEEPNSQGGFFWFICQIYYYLTCLGP